MYQDVALGTQQATYRKDIKRDETVISSETNVNQFVLQKWNILKLGV